MKFNPLRDWHYTIYVDAPVDQGSSFLMSLDLISWNAHQLNYLEAAIGQLQLLDDHYTVYAYPQLLTTFWEWGAHSGQGLLISNFCLKFLTGKKVDSSIRGLHEHNRENSIMSFMDSLRLAINKVRTTESLWGTYKDTLQFRDASIILSYLYAFLCASENCLHAVKSTYNDDSLVFLKEFLQSAYTHEYGRLSFIITCRILDRVDHENYTSNIKDHILKRTACNNILTEPDLAEILIGVNVLSPEQEEDEPDEETEAGDTVNGNGQKKYKSDKGNGGHSHSGTRVADEFYNLALFDELRKSCAVSDTGHDNYFFNQLLAPVPTSGIEREDLELAFMITCWQFNLLYSFYQFDKGLSLEFFDKVLWDPGYDIPYKSLPRKEGYVHTLYKLKTTAISKGLYQNEPLTEEDITRHTFSPFPNILRYFKRDFGIERDGSMWFQNEDEPLLYLRMGLFGFVAVLYLSDGLLIDSAVKDNLLKYMAYNASFDKNYKRYIDIRSHDQHNKSLEGHIKNKAAYDREVNKKFPFFIQFGSQTQLIVQNVLLQRTKSIAHLGSVNLTTDFQFKSARDFEVSNTTGKNDLYYNLVLPNALYYWITETYLSQTISNSNTAFLSNLFVHDAGLKVSEYGGLKPYYKPLRFNQNRLSCLLSFPVGKKVNPANFENYSFLKLDINFWKSPRVFFTAQKKKDLERLLSGPAIEKIKKIGEDKSSGDGSTNKKPFLYWAIKVLDIYQEEQLAADTEFKDQHKDIVQIAIDILHKELSSIKTNIELDRYVRLQLIRLMENPLLREDREDKIRENIIYLVLEYGGMYDIDLLYEQLFSERHSKDAAQGIQKKFIQGLYTILAKEGYPESLVSSPYLVAYKKNKADFIQKKISQLVIWSSKNNQAILDTLLNGNDEIKRATYGTRENITEKQVDTFLTEDGALYIEPQPGIAVKDIHAVYYDPNSYTANLLTATTQQVSFTSYNGKTISLGEQEVKAWNNETAIAQDRKKNYKNSEWLADVAGIRSGLHSTVEYPLLPCTISKELIPFPRQAGELLFFNRLCDSDGRYRMVLIRDNYTNPLNGKKGHLWTIAYGLNFFAGEDDYSPGTWAIVKETIKSIKEHYNGNDQPARGLIAFFEMEYDALLEKPVLNISKSNDGHPDISRDNIFIQQELFTQVTEATLKDGAWIVSPEKVMPYTVEAVYNEMYHEGQSRPFHFPDFLWNPFTNELTERPVNQQRPPAPRPEKVSKTNNGKVPLANQEQADPYSEELDDLLSQKMPLMLEAHFPNPYTVQLHGYKLPEQLSFNGKPNHKIKWSDTFKKGEQVKIIGLSPSNANCRSYFEDMGTGFNGYIGLTFWRDRASGETKLLLNTLKVKPFDLRDFGVFFNRLSSKNKDYQQLIYIGKYDADDRAYHHIQHEGNPATREYVFEFGYGRILILPESEIRILGASMKDTASILYYGDKVSNIKLERNMLTGLKLDSFTKTIYKESLPGGHNIVHTLYIDIRRMSIRKIKGSTHHGYNPDFTYKNANTFRLSRESVKELAEFYKDKPATEIVLYGKVDPESFERSNGRELEFNIIRLSNRPEYKTEGMMFFRAEHIYFENNAYRLKIAPVLDDAMMDTIEDDYLKDCYINKRDFSADAYKLVRLYNETKQEDTGMSDVLKNRLLLVKVSYDAKKERHSFSLIGSRESIASGNFQMPYRNAAVLHKQLETGPAQAIIVTRFGNYGYTYIIEIKPGIFVNIAPDNSCDFFRGDIIQVRKTGEKIFFNLLVPSDERYFMNTKFVNILPKNSVAEDIDLREPHTAKEVLLQGHHFVGADYTNIELSLEKTFPANRLPEFFKQESKLCLVANKRVSINLNNNFKYEPRIIAIDWGTKNLYINTPDGKNTGEKLFAHSVSFREAPYSDIVSTMSGEQWLYIDKKTLVWDDHDLKWKNKHLDNRRYANSPVPVYMDEKNRYKTRYPLYKLEQGAYVFDTRDLAKISLPTRALLTYLKEKTTNPDKGILLTVVCREGNTIWLELCPGRIAEVNAGFLRLQHTQLSMASINPELMCTGDQLELYRPEMDHANDGIEEIHVLSWIPSARNSFSPGTLLPCSSYNMNGSVVVGEGIFKMVLPAQGQKHKTGKTLCFFNAHDNYLEPVSGKPAPAPITCCMLFSAGGQVKLTIHKFEDYTIDIRAGDPFLKTWFTNEKILELLVHTGNYLPVTIEEIDHDNKCIHISRGYQNRIRLRNNDLLIYTLLARLDDTTILLRSSCLLFACPVAEFTRFIPGAVFSNELIKTVARKLSNKLCLTYTAKGLGIGIGLNELKKKTAVRCTFLGVVNDESNPGIIVFNQMHKSLHFIPYHDCFWIKQPRGVSKQIILATAFQAKTSQLYALLDPVTGSCSLITTEQAQFEFDAMQKEKNISIEYIAPVTRDDAGGTSVHIVRSKISGIYLLAESTLGQEEIRLRDKATVVYFSREGKNVLAVIGEKRRLMDTFRLTYLDGSSGTDAEKQETDAVLDAFAGGTMTEARLVELHNWGKEHIIQARSVYLYKPLQFLLFVKKYITEARISDEQAKDLKELSVSIVADMALRAIRERHTEVLVSKWLHEPNLASKKFDLWGRFNGIGRQVFKNKTEQIGEYKAIEKDDYAAIETLYRVAIPLRAGKAIDDQKIVGSALMIAIGRHLDVPITDKDTPIIKDLIKMGKSIISALGASGDKARAYDQLIDFAVLKNLSDNCDPYKTFFYLRENMLTKILNNELSHHHNA